jgi:hypothetical protein
MMGRKKSIALTDDVRQDAAADSREGAAAWMVFNYDSAMEFFDTYREAMDFADGLDELKEPAVVYPLYAGVGVVEQE